MPSHRQPEPRKPPTRRQIAQRAAAIRAAPGWQTPERIREGMANGHLPRPVEVPIVTLPPDAKPLPL
jgi:hypothetical protein